MKRIFGLVLVIYGVFAIAFGGYNQMLKNDDNSEVNDEVNGDINNENTDNTDKDNEDLVDLEDASGIINYLNDKYNLEFEVVKEVKSYCLDTSEYNLYYSEPCTDNKIKNEIYEVKSIEDDVLFYVKKVSFDETKVILPESEISNQSNGYYDNYMSYIVSDKIEASLQEKYKPLFGEDVIVRVYEGIGMYDISMDNAYQYLDNSNKDIIDKNISVKDYIDTIDENSISIAITVNQSITSDNFKDVVTILKDLESVTEDNISIDTMIIEYSNEDRYIEYDRSFDIIKLRAGEDKYSTFSDSEMLYDKSICVGSGFSTECIYYEEFINLDTASFNF